MYDVSIARLIPIIKLTFFLSIYLSIYTASPPLGDCVQVRVSAVLVEEMLLEIKSSHKIC